jgi:hypothetical protein
MSFDVLALAILFLVWAVLGCLSWLAVALRRRGSGALALLPLAAVGGIGGGLLTPALGGKDGLGLVLSLLVAVLGGLALTLAGLYFLQKLPGAVPPAHPR